jgi:ribonuclease T1
LHILSRLLSIPATLAGRICWLLAAAAIAAGGATACAREQPADPLPAVTAADLPPEARETLDLIDKGGPFPYSKDGSVFFNRERLLPGAPRGYYREYTVRTPESRDRGTRRIVRGGRGELYYTNDHYRTFKRVIR